MKRAAAGESERRPSKKRTGDEEGDVDYKKLYEESQQKYEKTQQELEKYKQKVKALSVETLLAAQPGQFDLKSPSIKTSPTNEQPHLSAKAYVSKEFEIVCPDISNLMERSQTKRQSPLYSRVLLEFSDGMKQTYRSEVDIAHLVAKAVKDALSIFSLENDSEKERLHVFFEQGLFSTRPDLLVVREDSGVGLLAIGVKQPVPDGKRLCEFGRVLGHAFDHAMAMKAFQMGTDLVLLTSFEESFLCSLNQSDLACSKEILNVRGKIGSTIMPQSPDSDIQNASQSPLKPKSRRSLLSSDSSSGDSQAGSARRPIDNDLTLSPKKAQKSYDIGIFRKGGTPRKLFISKTYKAHDLVKLVYTAVKIARSVATEKTPPPIYRFVEGSSYQFPRTLCVSTNSYDWGSLNLTIGERIGKGTARTASQRIASDYYIVGFLGRGSTSNVFLALNSSGNVVAVKMYVKNSRIGLERNRKDFDAWAEQKTKNEAKNLVSLNPCLAGKVMATKLWGMFCVVMPFFKPIEKKERAATLTKIEAALKRFKNSNKKYSDCYVRWRHIGIHTDKERKDHVVLFDLSDLEEATDGDDFVSIVVTTLKERIGDEFVDEGRISFFSEPKIGGDVP